MALTRRERFGFEGSGELMRRFLEGDWEGNGLLKVEEFRDGDDLVVRSELPGIDPDKDAELTVSNGMLHIRAERQEKSEDKGKEGYRSEFRYGAFSRTLPLPEGVNPDDITASYQDGVLEVRVPIPKETKESVSNIPVTRG
jgi:HSP20 family protein